LDFTADAAFTIDRLSAFFRAHAGAEADLAGAFYFADSMGVMHEGASFVLSISRSVGSYKHALVTLVAMIIGGTEAHLVLAGFQAGER
jgi:hypothetical protein